MARIIDKDRALAEGLKDSKVYEAEEVSNPINSKRLFRIILPVGEEIQEYQTIILETKDHYWIGEVWLERTWENGKIVEYTLTLLLEEQFEKTIYIRWKQKNEHPNIFATIRQDLSWSYPTL